MGELKNLEVEENRKLKRKQGKCTKEKTEEEAGEMH